MSANFCTLSSCCTALRCDSVLSSLDIIKTRLVSLLRSCRCYAQSSAPLSPYLPVHPQQTVHSQPAPTMSSVARQIWQSGSQSYIYQYPTTLTHALLRSLTRLKRTWHPGERSQFLQHWSTRVLGLRNFLVGYRPTVASSFIGSAATITVVEVTLAALQRWRDR